MTGFIDLHLHYVPDVDDGVSSAEDGLKVCRELAAMGYARLITTPHIRSGMFDNTRPGLEQAFAQFAALAAGQPGMPTLELSAEHHCDSLFWDLFEAGQLLPYPGAHALLLELPNEMFPLGLDRMVYKLGLKRLRVLLAHPERYVPVFKRTDPLDPFLDQGVGLQLDLMSLVGKYGRSAKAAAERMLEEGAYTVAATDCHHPEDLPRVAKALEILFKMVGDAEARLLLEDNPRRLLEGKVTE